LTNADLPLPCADDLTSLDLFVVDAQSEETKLKPVACRRSLSCNRILSIIFSTILDGLALEGPKKVKKSLPKKASHMYMHFFGIYKNAKNILQFV
jgi:hypothetical protein